MALQLFSSSWIRIFIAAVFTSIIGFFPKQIQNYRKYKGKAHIPKLC
jgi:hypothetical protein